MNQTPTTLGQTLFLNLPCKFTSYIYIFLICVPLNLTALELMANNVI